MYYNIHFLCSCLSYFNGYRENLLVSAAGFLLFLLTSSTILVKKVAYVRVNPFKNLILEPKKYAGKTVKFKGQVARLRREKDGMFAPGRFVMTCCEADITFMGIPCRFVGADGLKPRSWVTVRAEVEVRYHNLYHGVGPILNAISISPAEPAQQQVATF